MKKKTLLLTLLALAIITSISAGTLAVYTKSVDLKNEAVVIKKFAFAAAGELVGDAQSINLAPTESQKYSFLVTNYEGTDGAPAEVPLDYTISIDFSDAAKKMPGLTAVLLKDGESIDAVDKNGTITYTDSTPGNTATKHEYELTMTWAGQDNTAHSNAGNKKEDTKGLKINVNATQATNPA